MAPNENSPNCLVAKDLVFGIKDAFRVGPINLTLDDGQTLGVVGETGSGKSLLCRTLVGMLEIGGGSVESGSLKYDGVEFANAERREWAKLRRQFVSYMPQSSMSGLNPVRRVGSQMVELLTGSRSDRKAEALELFEQVQLRDPSRVFRAYPHELSGGMRQRVMLAFSLIGDPRVLVADEPTTALDATVQREILELLKQIQTDRGMALVIVSHDMKVIRFASDRVAVMYDGQVVEQGTIADVLDTPQHPYTQALLKADPAFAEPKSMLGTVDDVLQSSASWVTHDERVDQ